MQNSLKLGLFFLSCITLLTSCENEVPFVDNMLQSNYKTVSIDDAKSFLTSQQDDLILTKSNNINLNYDIDLLSQEPINNSNELLAVLPATTKYENTYSRILLLLVDGSLKSVLFNMIPSKDNTAESFFGTIIITQLDGKIKGAFKVENGILVAQYVINDASKNGVNSKNDCDEGYNTMDIYCIEYLEVVEINATNTGGNEFSFSGGFWGDGNINIDNTGESSDESWNFGGDGNNSSSSTTVSFVSPDTPIANMASYLDCFSQSQGAEITIYIDQPIANNDTPFTSGSGKAGHAFIGIKQGSITRFYGLYPEGNAYPGNTNDPHAFGNNQKTSYDVSITFPINSTSLNNVLDDAQSYNTNYDLNSNNCTDYVIQAASLCGINLPDPQSTWTGGGGSNPGAFGQAVRVMSLPPGATRNNNGGKTNANSGVCN